MYHILSFEGLFYYRSKKHAVKLFGQIKLLPYRLVSETICYLCFVMDIKKCVSLVLACNLFIVALLLVPKFDIKHAYYPAQQEISTTDNIKIQGYTKNELNSTQQNNDLPVKETKALKYFTGILQVVNLLITKVKLTNQNLLLYTGAIQLAQKALIFPFHTFW